VTPLDCDISLPPPGVRVAANIDQTELAIENRLLRAALGGDTSAFGQLLQANDAKMRGMVRPTANARRRLA